MYHSATQIIPKMKAGPQVATSIEEILAKKNLPTDFYNKKHDISLADPIEKHAKLLFPNFYSVPYPKKGESKAQETKKPEDQPEKKEDTLARVDHGIQHVARAAIYAPVFVNLYRLFDHPEAKELTDENVKLIQIALLFHDAGREGEGKDEWDEDSAIMLYCYLTRVLNVAPLKAKLLAEAINSKDQELGLTDRDIEICNKIKDVISTLELPEKIGKMLALKMLMEDGTVRSNKLYQYSQYLFPEGLPDVNDDELDNPKSPDHGVEEKIQQESQKKEKTPQEASEEELKSKHYYVLQEDSDGKFSWIVDTQRKKIFYKKLLKTAIVWILFVPEVASRSHV